jgi:hypothetical protein
MFRHLFDTIIALALGAFAMAMTACDDDDNSTGDAGSGTDTDTDTNAGADAGMESEPVNIAIVNNTAKVRYIDWGISNALEGETALGCELSADGAGASWEGCSITPGCYHPCSSYAPGDECENECEPSYFVREVRPGATVGLLWDKELVVFNEEYCSGEVFCYDTADASSGLYRLSIRVYAGLDCGASDCVPDDDGFYADESPIGEPVTHSINVSLPSTTTCYEIAIDE